MSKIGYIMRCIRTMSFSRMFKTISSIHERTKKSRIVLFFDMVYCGLRFGAGYRDYDLNEWWTLNAKQRKTYITRGINNSLVKKLNDSNYYHILANKVEFNEHFSDCLGREWLNLQTASFEDFEKFYANIDTFIAKPLDGACGRGVVKVCRGDYECAQAAYDALIEMKSYLVEEYVVQHPVISAIYPCSVNTLRIVTVTDDKGKPHILYAFIRIGNGGRVVDNINAGGMAAPIDVDTGVINNVAFDKDYNYYDKHPYTDHNLIGVEIPYWNDACEFVIDAAKRIPQLRYVGWDVAITEKGPVFVEANHHPGHDIIQMPRHTPDKIGMLPEFKKYVNI